MNHEQTARSVLARYDAMIARETRHRDRKLAEAGPQAKREAAVHEANIETIERERRAVVARYLAPVPGGLIPHEVRL